MLMYSSSRVTSYINNLHPQHHASLYTIIESIISKAIPLWNMTLTPICQYRYTTRIKYQLAFDPDPETVPESQQPSQEEDEDEDDFWQRREDWEEAIRKAVPAEPGVFSPPPPPTKRDKDIDLVRDFGHRGLQIIVKLANIELTPERPDYEGGTWHVEGQMNEHICATALYYYDNENITESHLAFRQKSGKHSFPSSSLSSSPASRPVSQSVSQSITQSLIQVVSFIPSPNSAPHTYTHHIHIIHPHPPLIQ